ncbi:hypothetical protein [Lactococcus kimchii]|uniref:hypothetical protein n=1 Tax=Lactococcus sp. S-13 TaxID=2507158 RepID=UPI0010236C94|nr:hypothetical protein [Lactococcus sp. S-13]RZI48979.1 hypothetical protein EQJ87_05720 [Lactococcus sp. S-13]
MKFEEKTGYIHSYVLTVETKIGMERADAEFNRALEETLHEIQAQGYEIVDVKLSSGMTALWASAVRYLILYK